MNVVSVGFSLEHISTSLSGLVQIVSPLVFPF